MTTAATRRDRPSALQSVEAVIDPYPVYHSLRARSPVQWDEALGSWIVLGYEHVITALRDSRLSVERPSIKKKKKSASPRSQLDRYMAEFMMFRDAPAHTALRASASRAFSAGAIESLRPLIEGIVTGLLADAARRRRFDVIRDLSHPLPIRVLAAMLGAADKDVVLFERWSADFGPLVDPTSTLPQQRALVGSLQQMAAYFRRRARQGGKENGEGILAALSHGGGDGADEILISNVLMLIVAGHVTATNLIGNGTLALLQQPSALARLREDPSLINSAVEEILRYDSPVQWTGRYALETMDLAGNRIESGETVSLCLGAANRDPARFPDPDRFVIDRADNRHVAFGYGAHFCLGAVLARLEAQIAIGLLAGLSDLRLAGDIEWHSTRVVRGLRSLPVRIDRKPQVRLAGSLKRSERGYALTQDMLDDLLKRNWDRAPRVLAQPLATPLLTGEEAFEAVRRACAAWRSGDLRARITFAVDDFLWTGSEAGDYLPGEQDATFDEYAVRMARRFEGRKFAIVVDGLQLHDERLWRRMREFLRPLSERIPAYSTNACIFLGNYDRTVYGIHRDPASIFQFVIAGRKRMRVWPAESFTDRDGQVRRVPGQGPDEGTVLEGGPGDILFWPSSYWHVGEGLGVPTIALSLGVVYLRPSVDAWKMLMKRVEETVAETINGAWAQGGLATLHTCGDTVPKIARLAQTALRKAAADPGLLSDLRENWLNQATALGSHFIPEPLAPRELLDDERVSVDPAFPIAWMPLPDHEMLCSAGGHSITVPASPRLHALIQALNSGRCETVGVLMQEFAGASKVGGVRFIASPEAVRTLLTRLYSFRALRTVNLRG